MNRNSRNTISVVILGYCISSFVTHLFLFYDFFYHRPRLPNPALGFTCGLNNHGSYIYLSPAESTGMVILFFSFFPAFILLFAIVPKEIIPPPATTPKWIARTSVRYRTDFGNPTPQQYLILGFSICVFVALIYFFGTSITELAIQHNFIFC